jgi:pimeloyl-ACP methyl ester carboxylesterase
VTPITVQQMLQAFAAGRLFGTAHGSGPPWALALHGWRRDHHDFDATLDGIDALALDLPGFGATPEPSEPWGAADYAAAVEPVLEELPGPVVVLGHSFGGRVAVHLAARRPERVSALVLTGVPLIRSQGAARPALSFRLARALNRWGVVSDGRMEALREKHGSADYRAAKGVMRDVFVRVVNESYEDQLRAVRCPVELVWGDDDREAPIAVAEQAAAIVPGATLTRLPGAGHLTPTTAPGALRDALLRHKP